MGADQLLQHGDIAECASCLTRHCYESSLGVLHYLDSGQERAETVVFLHGFTGSSRDFLTLPDQILSHYRCLIPDLPGHGQTQVLEAANTFQTEGQIRLLQQWLTSLEQTRFHLFGYSMGGRLALQFAVRNRQQLDSLMLVSTTAGIHEKGLRQKRAELDSQLAQKILNAKPIDFLTRWLSQPIFQGISEQGEAYIAEEVNRRLPIQPSGLAYSLKYFGAGVMPSVWLQLKQITVPALVIAGSRDAKYLSLASELVKPMPNARLEILETTHAPLVEAPDALWKKVANFLRANAGCQLEARKFGQDSRQPSAISRQPKT